MREVLIKTRKSEEGLYDTIQVLDENGKLIWCKFVHHKDKEKGDEEKTPTNENIGKEKIE